MYLNFGSSVIISFFNLISNGALHLRGEVESRVNLIESNFKVTFFNNAVERTFHLNIIKVKSVSSIDHFYQFIFKLLLI